MQQLASSSDDPWSTVLADVGRSIDLEQSARSYGAFAEGVGWRVPAIDAADYPADRVIALYRMRWQIELALKRLKNLIGIDKLPARDPGLARAWLAAHLIVARLIDAGTGKVLDSPPCASGQLQQPLALARTQGAPRLDHDGHRRCHLR